MKQQDRHKLLVASMNLCNKLKEIHSHPDYISVWVSASIHQGRYKGPTYENELQELCDAVTEEILKNESNE